MKRKELSKTLMVKREKQDFFLKTYLQQAGIEPAEWVTAVAKKTLVYIFVLHLNMLYDSIWHFTS